MNWLHKNSLKVVNVMSTGSKLAGVVVVLLCYLPTAGYGQSNMFLKQGNKLYEQMKYDEAAANYAKALQKNPNSAPTLFNLGNTLYQQKKYDESRKLMEQTAKVTGDIGSKSAANYNVGNTYMSQQKWQEAVDAYKQSLRNNPQDADAKYNLSYAEEMLKKQNQDNKKNNKQNKQNKDQQNKDKQKQDQKQDKDKDKEKQDQNQKQDQNKEDQKQDQEKDQKPQGQPSKLSQQQADQLLNALQQEEKKLQDKMKKDKGVRVRMQKDW